MLLTAAPAPASPEPLTAARRPRATARRCTGDDFRVLLLPSLIPPSSRPHSSPSDFFLSFSAQTSTEPSKLRRRPKSPAIPQPKPNQRDPGHLHLPSYALDLFFPGALAPSSRNFTSRGRHCRRPFVLGFTVKLHPYQIPAAQSSATFSTPSLKPPRPVPAPVSPGIEDSPAAGPEQRSTAMRSFGELSSRSSSNQKLPAVHL